MLAGKHNVLIDKGEKVAVENVANLQNIIVIFPNPNPGIFSIQFQDKLEVPYCIEIVNVMGNRIYQNQNISQEKFEVNIFNHPKGIYFVKVQAGDNIFIEKIIYR